MSQSTVASARRPLLFVGTTRSTSRVSLFASHSATTGMPTFSASRSACWSAAGSVTRRTSGSMNSGRFGFVSVPGTNRPASTFDPTFFAKSRAGFWPYWRAANRARLDAEASERHGKMGDRLVGRLAGPMGHHGREPGFVGQVHGGPRLGKRPNLVRLNKDSVAGAEFDPALQPLDIRHEDV